MHSTLKSVFSHVQQKKEKKRKQFHNYQLLSHDLKNKQTKNKQTNNCQNQAVFSSVVIYFLQYALRPLQFKILKDISYYIFRQ